MTHPDLERAAILYLPLLAALIARIANGRQPRHFVACLLGVLWTLPALLVLQCLNQRALWWSFDPGAATLRGMPLELFAGWTILWGILPTVAMPRLGVVCSAAILFAADCLLMPLATSSITLGPHWLVGEAVAIVLVLLPALCLARWTVAGTHLNARAALQTAAAGLVSLHLIPEIIFALRPGAGWRPLLGLPGPVRQAALQVVFLLALPGVAAVMEFAGRGHGTPIPYDPPDRLVTSGVYRFCANPMQLSSTLVLLGWAILLRNPWLLAAPLLAVVYGAGIAEWDERADLSRRFGDPWRRYRAAVPNWHPRWRPFHAGPPALLYIARTCGPCSELRIWFETRQPIGLRIVDAETLPQDSIRRVRYDPCDGTAAVEGVRAVGRALEHLNLGWAVCGAALRLPVVWMVIQLLLDASGLGPRRIVAAPKSSRSRKPGKNACQGVNRTSDSKKTAF